MTNNRDERRYRKWESDHEKRGTSELIPAATVVIMRDSESAIELLMLRKNSKVAFGGMWVFPGGAVWWLRIFCCRRCCAFSSAAIIS